MDKLATAPALDEYDRGLSRCAVHQQTQRIFALPLEDGDDSNAVIILDSHLQVVATVEAAESWRGEAAIRDVAVHGDQVLVLTTDHHLKGSGLRLIDLDGRFVRSIAAGQFRNPQAVAASDGRAFVVDEDYKDYEEDEEDEDDDEDEIRHCVLHVIDIHSGDILQEVRIDLVDLIAAVLVDGDEIYIAGFGESKVVVLPFAGSEA